MCDKIQERIAKVHTSCGEAYVSTGQILHGSVGLNMQERLQLVGIQKQLDEVREQLMNFSRTIQNAPVRMLD